MSDSQDGDKVDTDKVDTVVSTAVSTAKENMSSVAGDEEASVSHLFRKESLVSDADLRVDTAKKYMRFVAGDEEVSVRTSVLGVNRSMTFTRGSRDRTAGSYVQHTHSDEVTLAIGDSVEETVEGGVHQKAAFSAEAMIGGGYAHTVLGGPYVRIAGWVDSMVWGGWGEVDSIRMELSLLMIRSHFGYAHAAAVRTTMASRLIDDFQTRAIHAHLPLQIKGTTYLEAGDPSGGVQNEV